MMDNLTPVSAESVPCKLCGNGAALYGVVDFHRCVAAHGAELPLCGVPIYYRRCGSCGFLFTDAFDRWSEDQFKAHIYNDGYYAIDPDYASVRPRANADRVIKLWGRHRTELRVLDFGGGNGVFCDALRANGFPAVVAYDPMSPDHARRPEGKFDLVTCFETLEHLTDPVAGIGDIVQYLAEPGLVLFSTIVQPEDFDRLGLSWWYVGPRNGHVSLFSRQALALAWRRHGLEFGSSNGGLHFAFRVLPSFAAHLVEK